MNCHTQILKGSPEIQKIAAALAENKPIEWVKVNDLPDHVALNVTADTSRRDSSANSVTGKWRRWIASSSLINSLWVGALAATGHIGK